MGALPTLADIQSARAITQAEWIKLRQDSLAAGPGIDGKASLSAILLKYQQKLIATVSTHAITVVEKSRRTGATWGIGGYAVITSSSAVSAGGMDSIYIGYNLDMAREFIDCCGMWARAFNEALVDGGVEEFMFLDKGTPADPDKFIGAFRIRFASGFEIVALASRPRSLRGRQGFVILDEAAFHDDLQEMMKAALALLIWGGRVLIISTHNGEENYYNTLVKEAKSGTKGYGFIRFDFDDALQDGLYQRVCLRTGVKWTLEGEAKWRDEIVKSYGDAADEELFCIPAEGSGTWLSAPLIEARARPGIPVLRLSRPAEFTHWPAHLREADIEAWCEAELLPVLKTLDPHLWHYMGADYGRVSDLTVLWPLAIGRTLRRITPFVVEMRKIPFAQQAQVQRYIMKRLPRYGASKHDATGLGMALAEYAAQDFGVLRAEPVTLSVAWYRDNSQPVKTAFENDMIEIPADADIASDLRLVRVKGGIPFMPALKSGVSKDRHGDAAVALILAVAATYAAMISYDYESARTQGESQRGEDVAANEDDEAFNRQGLH